MCKICNVPGKFCINIWCMHKAVVSRFSFLPNFILESLGTRLARGYILYTKNTARNLDNKRVEGRKLDIFPEIPTLDPTSRFLFII